MWKKLIKNEKEKTFSLSDLDVKRPNLLHLRMVFQMSPWMSGDRSMKVNQSVSMRQQDFVFQLLIYFNLSVWREFGYWRKRWFTEERQHKSFGKDSWKLLYTWVFGFGVEGCACLSLVCCSCQVAFKYAMLPFTIRLTIWVRSLCLCIVCLSGGEQVHLSVQSLLGIYFTVRVIPLGYLYARMLLRKKKSAWVPLFKE